MSWEYICPRAQNWRGPDPKGHSKPMQNVNKSGSRYHVNNWQGELLSFHYVQLVLTVRWIVTSVQGISHTNTPWQCEWLHLLGQIHLGNTYRGTSGAVILMLIPVHLKQVAMKKSVFHTIHLCICVRDLYALFPPVSGTQDGLQSFHSNINT